MGGMAAGASRRMLASVQLNELFGIGLTGICGHGLVQDSSFATRDTSRPAILPVQLHESVLAAICPFAPSLLD